MKKLMIAACAVALAAVAQANTIQWGIAAGSALDAEKFATGKAYLICIDEIAKPAVFETGVAAADWYKDNGSSLASSAFRTGDIEDGYFISDPELIDTLSGRKSYWVAFVNGEGTEFAITTATKGVTWTSAVTSTSMTYTSTQLKSYEIVPEPTTGLLMLLGMGALALRRRRA